MFPAFLSDCRADQVRSWNIGGAKDPRHDKDWAEKALTSKLYSRVSGIRSRCVKQGID